MGVYWLWIDFNDYLKTIIMKFFSKKMAIT